MSKEIKTTCLTGKSLYAVILNSAGQVWNGSAFVSINVSNWGTYAVTVLEQSTSGTYYADMPTAITAADDYKISMYLKVGGSASTTDPVTAEGSLFWTGDRASVQQGGSVIGSVTGSPSSTVFAGSSALSSVNNAYTGSVIAFISGALVPEARQVTGYVGSTKTFTVTAAFTTAPAAGDNFILLGRIN